MGEGFCSRLSHGSEQEHFHPKMGLCGFLFDFRLLSRHETIPVLLLKFHVIFDQNLGIVPTLFRNPMTCFPDS